MVSGICKIFTKGFGNMQDSYQGFQEYARFLPRVSGICKILGNSFKIFYTAYCFVEKVLESIYHKELEIVSSAGEDSRNAFQLAVHVDLPKKPTLVECWAFSNSECDQTVVQTATSGNGNCLSGENVSTCDKSL